MYSGCCAFREQCIHFVNANENLVVSSIGGKTYNVELFVDYISIVFLGFDMILKCEKLAEKFSTSNCEVIRLILHYYYYLTAK